MTAQAAQKDVLRVGLESPVHTLDPGKAQDLVSALVVRQVFETPLVLGTDAGPYRVAGQARNALHLDRNPCYDGPVGFREILFTVYPPGRNGDNEALVRAIESGEVPTRYIVVPVLPTGRGRR